MKKAVAACLALLFLLAGRPVTAGKLPAEKDDWVRVRTANFTLLSNAGTRRALKIGKKLEQLREVLSETSKGMTLVSPLPTTIYVFRNETSFNPYNLGEDGEPDNVAGYFLRSDTGNYVAINADAQEIPYPIIYHEFIHYFLENNVPAIPLWLNEGLAEFYSTFAIFGGKAEIGRPVDHHIWWLSNHRMLPLGRLFAVDNSSPDYNEESRQTTFYAQSWALAHYLLVNQERRGRMGKLFALLSRGMSGADALETVLGIDLATIEQELVAHIESGGDRFFRYTPEEDFDRHTGESEPLERREVLFHLGDLLANHPPIQLEDAERHLQAALALDEKRPDVHLALASLRLEAERFDEAADLAQRAIQLDAKSPRAYELHGTSLYNHFVIGQDPNAPRPESTPPTMVRAREQFRKALELSPDHVESLIGLGMTYLWESGDVTEGVDALARAFRARPARTDILGDLIVVTAMSGNLGGARSLLDRSLRPRGDAEQARRAEAVLASLELEEAQALFDQGKIAEGVEAIRAVADRVQDSELKRNLLQSIVENVPPSGGENFEQLRAQAIEAAESGDAQKTQALLEQINESVVETNQAVDLYNEGIRLAQDGKPEEAVTIFDQIGGMSGQPDLQAAARSQAQSIRAFLKGNRHVDEFNKAIELLNAGKRDQAAVVLRGLLEDEPREDLREHAERILGEIELLDR